MKRRRTFNGLERQAILLLEKIERDGYEIPRDIQKQLSAKTICSWFDADHWPIRHELGGDTHPSNGQMLLNKRGHAALAKIVSRETIDEHGAKTKRDATEIAKGKRIRRDNEEHQRIMDAKAGRGLNTEDTKVPGQRLRMGGNVSRETKPRSRWPSRKMQSRPFPKGKRPMRGSPRT